MRRLRSSRRSARAGQPRGGVPDCWRCRAKTVSGREAPASRRRVGGAPRIRASPGPPRCRHSNCCVISESIRARTGCGGRWRWSETTAVGSTPDSRSSAARSRRASMAGRSHWAPTSIKTSMAWSHAYWVSSSRTAGGTARRRTVPSARRSRPRSTSWRVCWRTSAQPVALGNPSRLDAGARSTSSNESWSDARAPAKSSTQPGCNSRFRPAGTTTCCVPSSTFAPSGMCRTRGWTKPSICSDPSDSPMAPGCWRTRIRARSTSPSRTATVGPAGGTRCGRCESSAGTSSPLRTGGKHEKVGREPRPVGIGAHLEQNRRTRGLARGNPQQNAQAHQGSSPGRRRGVEVDGHSGLVARRHHLHRRILQECREAYLRQRRVSQRFGPSLQLESRRKHTPRDRHPRRRRSWGVRLQGARSPSRRPQQFWQVETFEEREVLRAKPHNANEIRSITRRVHRVLGRPLLSEEDGPANCWEPARNRMEHTHREETPKREDESAPGHQTRRIALGFIAVMMVMLSMGEAPMAMEGTSNGIKNVVLVHGGFVDGSGWEGVFRILNENGYDVTVVQNSTISLAGDVAVTKRALAAQDGPAILVGHSYGGVVITEAGNDPNVAGLVYVAAFAPDANQSIGEISSKFPKPPGADALRPLPDGYLLLTPKGIEEDFAQDLTPAEKALLVAVQPQTAAAIFDAKPKAAAWKNKPSWYVIASNDRMIAPEQEQAMAQNIRATTSRLASSHAAMLSHPKEVAEVIAEATQSAGAR